MIDPRRSVHGLPSPWFDLQMALLGCNCHRLRHGTEPPIELQQRLADTAARCRGELNRGTTTQ